MLSIWFSRQKLSFNVIQNQNICQILATSVDQSCNSKWKKVEGSFKKPSLWKELEIWSLMVVIQWVATAEIEYEHSGKKVLIAVSDNLGQPSFHARPETKKNCVTLPKQHFENV